MQRDSHAMQVSVACFKEAPTPRTGWTTQRAADHQRRPHTTDNRTATDRVACAQFLIPGAARPRPGLARSLAFRPCCHFAGRPATRKRIGKYGVAEDDYTRRASLFI